MLPFDAIWEIILKIHSVYETPFSLGKRYLEIESDMIEKVLNAKNDFYLATSEYAEQIENIMDGYNENIDFSFRYKEDFSIEEKLSSQTMTRQLYKIANDILGMRFIIKTTPEGLYQVAKDFVNSCPERNICDIVDQLGGKKHDDGYKGIHINIRPHNQVFPIEIQLWTRTHALLNEYLHDTIYKIIEDESLAPYALELRNWLEKVPTLPEDSGIMSYVDYIYERMD